MRCNPWQRCATLPMCCSSTCMYKCSWPSTQPSQIMFCATAPTARTLGLPRPHHLRAPSSPRNPAVFRSNTSTRGIKTVMASSIKLYGAQFSTHTRIALMVLEEKGIAYELVPVDLLKGEQKLPEHLVRQPFGVVPVLDDGDLRLTESRTIARYLATAYADQGPDLIGKDVKQRAITDNWMEVESHYFHDPCFAVLLQRYLKPKVFGSTCDEAIVTAKLEELNKILDVYEVHLGKNPYLAGDFFSVADIAHIPFFQYALDGGATEILDKHPNVKAWWERVSTRPTWKKISSGGK